MAQSVENVYSEAFFELCAEADCIDTAFEELGEVSELIFSEENRDYARLLASPLIKDDDKRKSLESVFGGRVSDLTLDFLSVLSKNGRIMFLPAVYSEFKKLYYKKNNIMEVTAVTSQKMSAGLREKLVKKLEQTSKNKVILIERLDPSILGGIILKYQDTEIDASVASGLDRIKAQIDGVIA